MTEADVIAHWRKGAQDALEAARLLHTDGKYALALFNCHLAVEKALKAQHMEEKREEAPPTHDLFLLARQLQCAWTAEQEEQLGYLTEYAVASRYDDPPWAEQEANEREQRTVARRCRGLPFLSCAMKQHDGLRIARQFKALLRKRGFPVQRVILYGSVAKGTAQKQSDIDIAVVAMPFRESQMQENVDVFLASKDIDLRIETVTLHPEDFDRPFFTLAREIERTGVEV